MFSALGRLMKYITGIYKFQFIMVIVGIVCSSIGQVVGIMEMRYLIDDYIIPFIGQENPEMSELENDYLYVWRHAYAVTVFFFWLFNRLMINIAQGTLKQVRDEMFEHMQSLPIRYLIPTPTGI